MERKRLERTLTKPRSAQGKVNATSGQSSNIYFFSLNFIFAFNCPSRAKEVEGKKRASTRPRDLKRRSVGAIPQRVSCVPLRSATLPGFSLVVHGSVHQSGPIISIHCPVLSPHACRWIHCHHTTQSTPSRHFILRKPLNTTLMRRYTDSSPHSR